jgi:hypothetical protein
MQRKRQPWKFSDPGVLHSRCIPISSQEPFAWATMQSPSPPARTSYNSAVPTPKHAG